MEEGFVVDGIRAICATLDNFIYGWIIPMLYDFIMALAEVNPFKDNAIEDFATRVYSLLALFMLFKISFSFITYIVNPEQMVDKTKGASNIIKNVIIVLILIIITPRAFSLLRETQSAILHDNVLPKFILGYGNDELRSPKSLVYYDGTKGYCTDSSNNIDYNGVINAATTGDYISLMIFRNFFNVDDDYFNQDPNTVRKSLIDNNFCDQVNNVTAKSFLHASLYNSAPEFWDGTYVIDYWIIISTVVGVGVALMLLTICMDVAVRSIKLGFLQIISPIPIISYMDPNSGKSGMFKKWLTEVGKTWANLFIRLASLFFAVYAISQLEFLDLSNISIFSSDDVAKYSFFIELFLIIGALMFAKQLPQLLETLIPGLKSSGSFQLNPFKNIRENALGGNFVAGAVTGAAAGSLATIGGFSANAWNIGKNANKNRKELGWKDGLQKTFLGTDEDGNIRSFRNGNTGIKGVGSAINSLRIGASNSIGSVVGGAGSSAVRAVAKGKDGKWKPLKNAAAGITESSAKRNQRNDGIGFKENSREKITSIAGIKNDYGLYGKNSDRIKQLSNQAAEYNTREEIARKAQIEYESGSNYSADSFIESFRRNPEGTGELVFEQKDENGNYKYSGKNKYERYVAYMNKEKKGITYLDSNTFDQYSKLDFNTHYYNVEHEKIKKELSKAQNLFKKEKK